MRINKLLIFSLSIFLSIICTAEDKIVPRTLIALYREQDEPNSYRGYLSMYAEMPLNHLGLKLEYHNMDEELPDIINRDDVRGVITWFEPGGCHNNPLVYMQWLTKAIENGKKVVIIGGPGFIHFPDKSEVEGFIRNRFWRRLGLRDSGAWIEETYDVKFKPNRHFFGFERDLPKVKSSFSLMKIVGDDVENLLKVETEQGEGTLAICTSKGGYIAEHYACYKYAVTPFGLQWYINPFKFFEKVFATEEDPKPDVTTLAGRRIYFSHIDGDGWNSRTLIEKFRDAPPISAKIVLDYAIKPYPDLPVSVGPIAAEIDLDWSGLPESRQVGKGFFELNHVEIASHTYTHPYKWELFEKNSVEKVNKFKPNPKVQRDEGLRKWIKIFLNKGKPYKAKGEGGATEKYDTARAYEMKPFDLKQEIVGSFRKNSELAPTGKKGKILLWSGNTTPFEEALKLCREAGYKNMNGGDSRFDDIFPSYLWVAPIGRQVGVERQIYSVCSNENTYTDLWEKNHHGYKYLIKTLENTEHPIRIKPINIYYHMYSGERTSSINAITHNLDYVRSKEVTPIMASHYCGIAEGFYSTEIVRRGEGSWLIKNRGELQTIRFDAAIFKGVDFTKSKGVIGQKHYQGSLYIYLDSMVNTPLIKIKKISVGYEEPKEDRPYLLNSRWVVKGVNIGENIINYKTKGFGVGSFAWSVPKDGVYLIEYKDRQQKVVSNNRKLLFDVPINGVNWVKIKIELEGVGER